MSADDTYAPKSPDLSSFFSPGPTATTQTPAQPQAPAPYHHHDPQQQQQPQQQPHQHQLEHQQPHLDYPHPNPAYGFVPPPYGSQAASPGYPGPPIKPEYHDYYSPPSAGHYLPPEPHQQPTYAPPHPGFHHQQQQGPYGQQPYPPASYGQPYPPQAGASSSSPLVQPKLEPQYDPEMPPRRSAAAAAPVIDPSPVRTKFPTARIKRIMQADEEVGKVAQQTPIAVGKALEMFMVQLVTKSADIAREKGSKRVTAPMLKQVVETDEQWDFLRDIVSRVEGDKDGGKSKVKAESDSDDEEVAESKKKPRGGRRKKA